MDQLPVVICFFVSSPAPAVGRVGPRHGLSTGNFPEGFSVGNPDLPKPVTGCLSTPPMPHGTRSGPTHAGHGLQRYPPGSGRNAAGGPKVGEPPAYLRTAPGRGMFRSPVVPRRHRGFRRRPPGASPLPRLPAAPVPTLPAWGMFPARAHPLPVPRRSGRVPRQSAHWPTLRVREPTVQVREPTLRVRAPAEPPHRRWWLSPRRASRGPAYPGSGRARGR
jgi:hypothetical protein